MTMRETLIEEIMTLPDDLAEQVFDYVSFIRARVEQRREAFAHQQKVKQVNGHTLVEGSTEALSNGSSVTDADYAAMREALKNDPLVGMIAHGNIAERAEEILAEGITRESGWTIKPQ